MNLLDLHVSIHVKDISTIAAVDLGIQKFSRQSKGLVHRQPWNTSHGSSQGQTSCQNNMRVCLFLFKLALTCTTISGKLAVLRVRPRSCRDLPESLTSTGQNSAVRHLGLSGVHEKGQTACDSQPERKALAPSPLGAVVEVHIKYRECLQTCTTLEGVRTWASCLLYWRPFRARGKLALNKMLQTNLLVSAITGGQGSGRFRGVKNPIMPSRAKLSREFDDSSSCALITRKRAEAYSTFEL